MLLVIPVVGRQSSHSSVCSEPKERLVSPYRAGFSVATFVVLFFCDQHTRNISKKRAEHRILYVCVSVRVCVIIVCIAKQYNTPTTIYVLCCVALLCSLECLYGRVVSFRVELHCGSASSVTFIRPEPAGQSNTQRRAAIADIQSQT